MNNPKTKIENIVVQELENEVLIYDLSINKAFCLNQTSAMIWGLSDGKHSIEQISQILSHKLNEPITEDLIWLALDQFKRDGLLEDGQFEIDFNGLNRRQIIKKVGLASMVMLPSISSVVAPSAVMAQSGGIALLGACPSGTGCASGLNCYEELMLCCIPGGSRAPGDNLPLCDAPSCRPSECCSGMAVVIPGICVGGDVTCQCV